MSQFFSLLNISSIRQIPLPSKKSCIKTWKKMTKIVVASFCGKLALFCFHWAFSTTFRSYKNTSFVAPTSFSTCGSFFELTQYCWYATIFHTQNTWVELERLKMCHEVKKSAPAAWSDSYIFLFDQNVVFLGFNQLVRKTAFSWVVAQFSTIFENVMSCRITVFELISKMVENCAVTQENAVFLTS